MLEFYRSQLSTPIGIIEIKADNRFIYSISFLEQENETKYKENVLSIEAKNQLQTYFPSCVISLILISGLKLVANA